MKIPRTGNFYYTLFFLVFLLILLATALGYNKKASFVPFFIGIPTALLIITELIRDQSPKFSKYLETDVFESK